MRHADRSFFLAVEDVQRVSAAGNYVEVHAGGKVHLVRDSLSDFILQLDPTEFLRVQFGGEPTSFEKLIGGAS